MIKKIKEFFMIKRNRYITAAVILVIVGIICIFIFKPAAPEVITVPAGQTEFSIDLNIDETEPFAGIEFALTISDEDALVFESFIPGPRGATASPFLEKDKLHYFGFYSGSNSFSAENTIAGTLNFTDYTSDQTLTVTVVQMKVIRVGEDNKTSTTEKDSPSHVFTIQRGE